MVLEKTIESPLDCKQIKLVNPKGNQSWIFIGRADAEAEVPVHWPPYVKSQLIGKHSDAGKERRQEEKEATVDEMVERHHRLNGYDFQQTPGDGEGQGSLACYSSWGHKASDRTATKQNSAIWRHPFPCLSILQHGKLLKNWVKSFLLKLECKLTLLPSLCAQ